MMDHHQKAEEDPTYEVTYDPPTLMGTFKAFASIMFAFAGASTFPTIQADMKERDKFTISAIIACTSKQCRMKVQFACSYLLQGICLFERHY